jgi:homoserine dehydrogenase
MMRCRVAIAGFGGVGSAVATLLLSRRERFIRLYGKDVRLVAVCGSRAGTSNPSGLENEDLKTLDPGSSGADFLLSSGADVLIEAGPTDFRTGAPGLDYIKSFLSAGRDAVVVSKGALVHSGRELRHLARQTGATLRISGATGAALPNIDLLEHALQGCSILQIEGILNATTNYLLDAMITDGTSFPDALAHAQVAGFAEADPRYDVEGWDTACKMLLLANFALDADLMIDDITVDGIQNVTSAMIDEWRQSRQVPKLVGRLWYEEACPRIRVGIEALSVDDLLAQVRGKNKAIRISTDTMGEITTFGCGTEPTATAAAALKDLERILASRTASVS